MTTQQPCKYVILMARRIITIMSPVPILIQPRGWGGLRRSACENDASPPPTVLLPHYFFSLGTELAFKYLLSLNQGGIRGFSPICSTSSCVGRCKRETMVKEGGVEAYT